MSGDFTNMSSNSRNFTEEALSTSNVGLSLSVFLMSVCCIFTMVGNFIVIVTVIRIRKGANKLTNRFIFSLAVADLCVGFFVLPSSIAKIANHYYWSKPLWFCKLWVTMDVGFICVSIYSLVSISIDRLYAVYYPISYSTKRSSKMVNFMIFMSWIMFFVVSIPMHIQMPPFSNWNAVLHTYKPFNASGLANIPLNCGPPQDPKSSGWVLYASIVAFILPTILLIVINTTIFFKIRQFHVKRVQKAKKERCLEKSFTIANKVNTIDDGENEVSVNPSASQNVLVREDTIITSGHDSVSSSSNTNTLDRNAMAEMTGQDEGQKIMAIKRKKTKELTRAEKKLKKEEAAQTRMTTMMAVVIGAFITCWAPFAIMFIGIAVLGDEKVIEILGESLALIEFITWLGYVNSFLNPIIYATMNPQMKKGFKDLYSDIKNVFIKNK